MPLKWLLYRWVLRFDKNTVLDGEFRRSDVPGRYLRCFTLYGNKKAQLTQREARDSLGI